MRPRISARSIQLRTVNFADAHVESWHEGPSDPNSNAHGGAFLSNGSITLTRSRLTAPWTWFLIWCLISCVRKELLKLHGLGYWIT